MKHNWFLAPLAASTLALTGCGYSVFDAADDAASFAKSDLDDGEPIPAEAAEVAAFDQLASTGPDKVMFTTASNYSVRADAAPDLLALLRYKIEDGGITVGRVRGKAEGRATIYVTAPALKAASTIGSGLLQVDRMNGDSIELSSAGSGGMTVGQAKAGAVDLSSAGSGGIAVAGLDTQSLDASTAGSGDMMLSGRAATTDISIAGSGDIDGSALATDNADVSIAGSGNVRLRSDGKVNASIMGSGDVDVTGSAQCDVSAMGSGKLRCAR